MEIVILSIILTFGIILNTAMAYICIAVLRVTAPDILDTLKEDFKWLL